MDMSAMIDTWVSILTRPGEETCRQEVQKPYATLTTAFIWVGSASIGLGLLTAIGFIVSGLLFQGPILMNSILGGSHGPAGMSGQFAAFSTLRLGVNLILALVITPIVAPVAFLTGVVIYFVTARLLGGTGDFEKHTYLIAAYSAPLLIVNGLVNIIPIVGGCIVLVINFYYIALTYFAVKVVHGLSPARAMIVALTPFLIVLLCLMVWLAALSAFLFNTMMSGPNGIF